MADIELVIKIPEVIMEYIKRNGCLLVYTDEVANAVLDGTPLPKGHGRLIDANALIPNVHGVKSITATLEAPTIIEADKESERMNELDAYIGAKIDEAVDAYDSSTESVKENIETVDDALAVSEERQKWKQAIKDFKAEIEEDKDAHFIHLITPEQILDEVLATIDKHTKELMK